MLNSEEIKFLQNIQNENIGVNSALSNPSNKLIYEFSQHPELVQKMSEWAEEDISPYLLEGNLDNLKLIISAFLEDNGVKSFGEGGQFETEKPIKEVVVGDKTYKLIHLISEEDKETGLMNVEDMEDDEGALFDYSENPQSSISFWMKDTTIALRILFINKEGVVISARDGEPLSEELITEESEPVYWVIELNQSEQIPQGAYTNLAIHDEPEAEPEDDEDIEDHPEIKVNKLYIYGSDGNVQAEIDSGCRIFSRKSTDVILRKAKRAYLSQLDKDYKALGRYIFNEIKAQDNRGPEYV